ncbi:hypothetical protein ASG38_15015 [Flavobacterium sp. Leaf359]|uniref:hypothetical protein n=1 Tax=Flavobacterium sp. Leaf359 TaxID=1736351 RepID=UPI0006FCC928|nr:hypothetical protein [Flavobacterium sp. Leaf359]KQS45918.1 hypothetical protein ASG38_15015 [Flavobacterium sp. Leaf359]
MKKVRFILSPTGLYGLGYNIGDVAEFEAKQADELIESGYAEPAENKAGKVKAETPENAADKAAAGSEKR